MKLCREREREATKPAKKKKQMGKKHSKRNRRRQKRTINKRIELKSNNNLRKKEIDILVEKNFNFYFILMIFFFLSIIDCKVLQNKIMEFIAHRPVQVIYKKNIMDRIGPGGTCAVRDFEMKQGPTWRGEEHELPNSKNMSQKS